MDDHPDDMQITPSTASRKRRAAHPCAMETNDDTSLTHTSSSSDNHQALHVWQQAFKRLRVQDHPENENRSNHAESSWQPQYSKHDQHDLHQVYTTPPTKTRAPEPPCESEYRKRNQFLGQLHRERRLRAQEESRRLSGMVIYTAEENHPFLDCYSLSSNSSVDHGSETYSSSLHSNDNLLQRTAVHLFGSPLSSPSHQRKVVQLRTDSKLE